MEKTITVSEVVAPAPGKKQYKVIDTNGDSWFVFPDKAAQFHPGMMYRCTDIGSSEFNGRTYYTIRKFEVAGGRANVGVPVTPVPMPRQPVQQHTMDHERRLDIFVCGALNSVLSGGRIEPTRTAMMHFVNDAIFVWKMTLGPNAPKAPIARGEADQEMDDSVNY